MMKLNTAVLFIVFNRPDTTKKVFQKIREVKPPKLYIAADGPRSQVLGEMESCKEVRKIATSIDWDCKVKTLFREKNVGCKKAVSSAIDWFFKSEEMGIILEDDCLPTNSFFQFCEEILDEYSDDTRIMHINGNNYGAKFVDNPYSYLFGSMPQPWGWATWRRAWSNFDLEMPHLAKLVDSKYLDSIFKNPKQKEEQIVRWKKAKNNKIDSWAFVWQYSVIANHGLTVVPKFNQISNIGHGENATHTTNKFSLKFNIDREELSFPLIHPDPVIPNQEVNRWYQEHMLGPATKIKRIRNKFLRFFQQLKAI